ncbi:hypothetical protein RchiOBHm_Chr7g0231621 [Rosa chinensis]|uniref:Uncharacterized protein n=1 Tax=Rosa chinensis TaxID=74649 RepID=A0A2P6PFS7_ROSCH|nr:hypothetical protein RchiOBHm_Chr7g0231621 [Rosa chinensis]
MLRLLSLRCGWRSWPLGGGSANWTGGDGISLSSGRREIEGGGVLRCQLLKILLLVFLVGVVCFGNSVGNPRWRKAVALGCDPGLSGSVTVSGSRRLVLLEQEDLVTALGWGSDSFDSPTRMCHYV